MRMAGSSVGVVGGGVLGMTVALRLAQQGHQVTLLESAPATGGLASPEAIGDATWDRFYHVMLLSDSHLVGLLDELGLQHRVHWRETRTGFYGDGRLHEMSSSLDFARFPLLTLAEKARLAATILHASRVRNPLPLEQEPVERWLRRWSGDRVFERMWLPLLRSKLGENYRIASAAFLWAIIARLYAARRSGLKRELFGHVDGGYATVLGALAGRLETVGVITRTSARVERVRRIGHRSALDLASGAALEFDHVVLTVPCPTVSRICPELSPAERERLSAVVYQGIICGSFLLSRPLGGYYVTNIVDEGFPFTGVIEMTTLVDPASFGGRTLVYLPRYLAQNASGWDQDDEWHRAQFLAGLQRMYPELREEHVLAARVSRARDVLAVTTLDYSRRCLPPLRTSLPGVYVVNSAQIAHGTLNVNETLALAERQAAALAAEWSGAALEAA
ncbi:MAG TPA: NAD(P)/FAD-dependent oxidoreductase [Gemmatimonadales bacterium]|nr:NAD(P)/FAD-dependent oxidoreductase [Gemmatimonadales bacterium]